MDCLSIRSVKMFALNVIAHIKNKLLERLELASIILRSLSFYDITVTELLSNTLQDAVNLWHVNPSVYMYVFVHVFMWVCVCDRERNNEFIYLKIVFIMSQTRDSILHYSKKSGLGIPKNY